MVSDTKKNLNNTIYGRANLPARLDMATDTVTYIYDANDMRIYKKVDSVGTMLKQEYYLRDATGRELAVINNTDGATWYIYGKERIASTRAVPKLNVKVWLEGAYEKDTMRTTLNQRGLLPGQTPIGGALATPTPAGQPYNTAPWYYDGSENITDYDPDVVDWVLLSLRKGLERGSEIFKTAALLHKNGQVKLASNIALPELTESVYIVIEHRNHSGIISAQKVNTLDYDFTLANSYSAVAAGQKEIVTGVWAMFAGNAVTDGQQDDINGDDKSTWAENNGKFDYYTPSDFNLDSDVNGSDKLLWAPNNGVFSAAQVSIGGISPPAELAVPQFIYYLYDHLGNTRVTYSVDIKTTTNIDYTVQSASDYYPYGKALRSYGKERYQSTYHERDSETDFDYRGARFYDGDVGRFNSLDPLAADYPSLSDYLYVAGNPLYFIDPTGQSPEEWDGGWTENHEYLANVFGDYDLANAIGNDIFSRQQKEIQQQESLLIMHRSPLLPLDFKYTNIWKATFSRKVGNREWRVKTPDGTEVMYMFGAKGHDALGDNILPKKVYSLKFKENLNEIKVTDFGVNIHSGNWFYKFEGCKGLCASYGEYDWEGEKIFMGYATETAIIQVRLLYEKYQEVLTGDKFILKTNSEAPPSYLGEPPKPLIHE